MTLTQSCGCLPSTDWHGRHLRREALISDPVEHAVLISAGFDPTLADEVLERFWAVRQRDRLHPAGASQMLQELPLTVVGRCHFLVFSLSSTRRPIGSRFSRPIREANSCPAWRDRPYSRPAWMWGQWSLRHAFADLPDQPPSKPNLESTAIAGRAKAPVSGLATDTAAIATSSSGGPAWRYRLLRPHQAF